MVVGVAAEEQAKAAEYGSVTYAREVDRRVRVRARRAGQAGAAVAASGRPPRQRRNARGMLSRQWRHVML